MVAYGVYLMFKNHGKFKPVSNYADYGTHYRFKYGKNLEYPAHIFWDIILAEHALRRTVQREETLTKRSLQKVASTEDDKIQLRQWYEELEALERTYIRQERDLYAFESLLPAKPLKRAYDSLRHNSAWYLREELVEDCVGCSRNCGCCERRQFTSKRRKGIGHCTEECGCCLNDRGFEFTAEEKKEIEGQLKWRLRYYNPAYLLKLTEAYFSEPKFSKLREMVFSARRKIRERTHA